MQDENNKHCQPFMWDRIFLKSALKLHAIFQAVHRLTGITVSVSLCGQVVVIDGCIKRTGDPIWVTSYQAD